MCKPLIHVREIQPECIVAANGAIVMNVDSDDPVLYVELVSGFVGVFERSGEEHSHVMPHRRIGVFVLCSMLRADQVPSLPVQARGVWWTLAAGHAASESISRARLALGWTDESTPQSTGGIRHEA